jgi:Protein of unknown function (DUF1566)
MPEGSGKKQEISLGDDFDAVVRYGGTTVELSASGSVIVKMKGDAVIYTNGDVKVRPAANDRIIGEGVIVEDLVPAAPSALRPGDKMSDGTIFAGTSPETHKPMYTTPEDAPLTYTFNHAQKYAAKLDAHGHHDWRVPTKGELKVMFQNRAAIGGFNVTGAFPAGWYWSSTEHFNHDSLAWGQRFNGGEQDSYRKNSDSSLRLVR